VRLNPGISRLENFRDPGIRESRDLGIAISKSGHMNVWISVNPLTFTHGLGAAIEHGRWSQWESVCYCVGVMSREKCHWIGWQWRHLLITFYGHIVDAILWGNWIVHPLSSRKRVDLWGHLSMPSGLNSLIYRCRSASGSPRTIVFRLQ